MIGIKQIDSLINMCKNYDIKIIGSKDSIDKLSGFITNALFKVTEVNELLQSEMVYIIPIREDKPKPIKATLPEIAEQIFKAIKNYKC